MVADQTSLPPTGWHRLIRSPWFAGVYTMLGLVAGLLGSVYDDQIANSVPLDCCRYDGPQWGASMFWLCAGTTAAMYLLQHRAAEADRKAAQDALERRSAELAGLIRTMPPREFLSFFAGLHEHAEFARRIALASGGDHADIELAIRYVLEIVALLARDFDREADPDVRYAANLMVFVPEHEVLATDLPVLLPRLRLMHPGRFIRDLRGVLVLRRELSAVAEADEPEGRPDPNVPEIALPIPLPDDERDPARTGETFSRWKVLPGAPMAFVRGELEVYTDADDMVNWCHQHGAFDPAVIAGIQAHFSQPGQHGIVSFASFPVYLSGPRRTALGVLNVHRNTRGMLREQNLAAQFAALLDPFRAILADLLMSLRA